MTRARMLLLAGLVAAAQAWDTQSDNAVPWHSTYLYSYGTHPVPGTATGFAHNEHAEASDIALRHLGVTPLLWTEYERYPIIDLNASVFRPHLAGDPVYSGKITSALELRDLPPPAMMAGIPDFSWSIYDWINKNQLCPLPEDAPQRAGCHSFEVWLGAGLNATHFGTQAQRIYERLHQVALDHAKRAAWMRGQLAVHPVTWTRYRHFVREAELMALSYEGYAQHFLQDRWSSGHMWERWNGGGYEEIPYKNDFSANLEIGAVSGLLHGSESTLKQPDPMCSPGWVRPSGTVDAPLLVVPATWRHGTDGPQHGGLGDYRLEDLYDGEYGGAPIDVSTQKDEMTACQGAGWTEVVRALGTTSAGHYGELAIPLADTAHGLSDLGHDCFDVWATNHTVRRGFGTDFFANLGAVVRATPIGDALNAAGWTSSNHSRLAWGKVLAKTWARSLAAPDDTDLARGGLPDFGEAGSGDDYADPPAYIVPANLDTLPDSAADGRDKHSLYGFFNRAHADWWCEADQLALAATWRGGTPAQREACEVIASRAYEGTWTRYHGSNVEHRTVDNVGGERIASLCTLLQPSTVVRSDVAPTAPPDVAPARLSPVYVDTPNEKPKRPWAPRAIERWCAAVPAIDLLPGKLRDQDIVALASKPREEVRITGSDFGDDQGEVHIGFGATERTTHVVSWTDTAIVFQIPIGWASRGEHDVRVIHRDGTRSVGITRLRMEPPAPRLTALKVHRGSDIFATLDGQATTIDAGPLEIELTFDQPMQRDPTVRLIPATRAAPSSGPEPPIYDDFKQTWIPIAGRLDTTATTWQGSMKMTKDADRWTGVHALSIDAVSARGTPFRGGEPPWAWKLPDGLEIDHYPHTSTHLAVGMAPPKVTPPKKAPPARGEDGPFTGCWSGTTLRQAGTEVSGTWRDEQYSFPRSLSVQGAVQDGRVTLRHVWTEAEIRDWSLELPAGRDAAVRALLAKKTAFEAELRLVRRGDETYLEGQRVDRTWDVPFGATAVAATDPADSPDLHRASLLKIDGAAAFDAARYSWSHLMLPAGAPLGIEAERETPCLDLVDTIDVRVAIRREGAPVDGPVVTLTETGPATGEFRGEVRLPLDPPFEVRPEHPTRPGVEPHTSLGWMPIDPVPAPPPIVTP